MQTPMFDTGEEQGAYEQGIADLLAHQARKKGLIPDLQPTSRRSKPLPCGSFRTTPSDQEIG